MTRLAPSAFSLEGGSIGVLLIHGFTGAPPEMRRVGDYLHERGFTISAPLLPGHGTTVEEMNRCQWTDWTNHVEKSLTDLQARCETVFVGGLSMGAVLALYLAAHHPELPGVIIYSPATWLTNRLIYLSPILKYVIPKRYKSPKSDLTAPDADLHIWSYEEYPIFAAHELLKLLFRTRRLLPQMTRPLLTIHSTLDQSIHPHSARLTCQRVGSADKELITFHNSGHAITVDSEWEAVAEKTHEFIRAYLPADAGRVE